MSFKRTRSLETLTVKSKSTPDESQPRRSTRLSSRVSEFDSRVTVFEPQNLSSGSVDELVEAGAIDKANGEPEQSPKRSRKRIKLDPEDVIADIEDLVYTQRTPKNVKSAYEEERTNLKSDSARTPSNGKHTASLDSLSKSKSPSKSKPVPQFLARPHPAPPHWRETYETIKSMRSRFVAPVDNMGCAQAQTGEAEPRVFSSFLFFLSE